MKNRLLSIDVLRGMTLIFMIIVNTPGSWDYVYAPLLHADWNGLTPTDYIFPNFLFIVGVSIVLSLNNKINELNRNQILKKIIHLYIIYYSNTLLVYNVIYSSSWYWNS
jgi:predicted acyltransferase